MTKIQEHFDVNEIIGIKLFPEHDSRFEWVEAAPEKRAFFGLIKTRSATPAGFLDKGSFDGTIYSEESLIGYGYKVYTTDERINNRVTEKPYVRVYLSHGLETHKKFETDEQALSWIEELKSTSGKTFEIVTFN
jgi:hypothetical protein